MRKVVYLHHKPTNQSFVLLTADENGGKARLAQMGGASFPIFFDYMRDSDATHFNASDFEVRERKELQFDTPEQRN